MRRPVERRAGDAPAADDAGPFRERQIRRYDGRAAFIVAASINS
jgi:hypothetical protein